MLKRVGSFGRELDHGRQPAILPIPVELPRPFFGILFRCFFTFDSLFPPGQGVDTNRSDGDVSQPSLEKIGSDLDADLATLRNAATHPSPSCSWKKSAGGTTTPFSCRRSPSCRTTSSAAALLVQDTVARDLSFGRLQNVIGGACAHSVGIRSLRLPRRDGAAAARSTSNDRRRRSLHRLPRLRYRQGFEPSSFRQHFSLALSWVRL